MPWNPTRHVDTVTTGMGVDLDVHAIAIGGGAAWEPAVFHPDGLVPLWRNRYTTDTPEEALAMATARALQIGARA